MPPLRAEAMLRKGEITWGDIVGRIEESEDDENEGEGGTVDRKRSRDDETEDDEESPRSPPSPRKREASVHDLVGSTLANIASRRY